MSDVQHDIWSGEPARIDRVLADLNLVRSRSQANEKILAGAVTMNGALVRKSGVKVPTGAQIEVVGNDHYVSRAAHKLIAGLDAFDVSPAGRACMDVGASTGGFTQVLCERGAARVLAVDVGHDQMSHLVSADPRVTSVEGCNAREMTPATLGLGEDNQQYPDLVVADLSFISLQLVLAAMVAASAPETDFVLLVKPQFEVGRLGVKGGLVTDPELAANAIVAVLRCASDHGLDTRGVIASPLVGGNGNQEFVVHFVRSQNPTVDQWISRVRELATCTIGTESAAQPQSVRSRVS